MAVRNNSLTCAGIWIFWACLIAAAPSVAEDGLPKEDAGQPEQPAASRSTVAPEPSHALFELNFDETPQDSIPYMRVRVEGTPVAVLRAGPGKQHEIVTTMPEESILIVDARTGEWLHVTTTEGVSGWIHDGLVSEGIDMSRFAFQPAPREMERQRKMHIAGFVGNYAADREDNGFLFGARMGYSLTSRISVEIGVGHTRITRSTFIIEELFNLRIDEETFDVFFYEAGGSLDILPGRRVTPFLAAGIGATVLNSRVEPTWSLAIGTRAFLSKSLALRWEIRDHRYEVGNQFTRFQGDNLEFSAGTELLF